MYICEDNVIRSAAILPGEVDEGKKEKDDSRDAENQNGTQDDEESIPESEEFRMDSVLMESIESGLNETDDNGDHPSKLRNKYQGGKRADEATQTTAQTGQDPALQLPSFQATALDFLTAVEDDGDYLSPLPDDDVEDNMLMKTIARARAETPNKLTTKRDFDKNRSQNLMEGMAVE